MIRIARKKDTHSGAMKLKVISVGASLAAGALIILALGYHPFEIYSEIIKGSIGSAYSFKETVRTVIPLVIMALGASICFRLQFINIGTEGQFYIGAMAATYFALNYSHLPKALLLAVMLLSAFAAAGLWCVIPALLKRKAGTNETLVTLMMNYIAIKWVAYLQYGPWKDPASMGFPAIATFTDNAIIPKVLGIHGGWIIALILTLVIHILLRKTEYGYQLSVMGESLAAARYAGFSTTGLLLITVMIGGGLCGIAGMIQASAVENTLTAQLANGMGFTAIIVAWLGRLKPLNILAISFLIAILLQGSAYIQISMKVPSSMAFIIQGIILFFILGSDFFSTYRFVWNKTEREETAE